MTLLVSKLIDLQFPYIVKSGIQIDAMRNVGLPPQHWTFRDCGVPVQHLDLWDCHEPLAHGLAFMLPLALRLGTVVISDP